MSVYRTVVVDPPWNPALSRTWIGAHDKARPQRQYDLLSIQEIIRRAPPLASQAHVYIWAINAHVDWAYQVAYAWSCTPVVLLTWVKSGLGVGRFQSNTEHVLIARKGSRIGNPFGDGGRSAATTRGTAFYWPRGRHSEKPQAFFDLVERLSPGPRLEMYARTIRDGWDRWGDEVPSNVTIPIASPTPPETQPWLTPTARVHAPRSRAS